MEIKLKKTVFIIMVMALATFTGHKIMKAPATFSELALANIDALASGEVDGGGGGRAGVGCPIWEITITIGPSGQTRTCHTGGQYICTDGLPCIK